MRIIVFGASGGVGSQAVRFLLEAGHGVTAFRRRTPEGQQPAAGLSIATGDVMVAADVQRAVPGHDAVIVALGITENAFRIRALGPRHTPLDVRSTGTRNVVCAMQESGVRRLVVVTSFGIGETRSSLTLAEKIGYEVLLAPQLRDMELQERAVTGSELDWVIVQPVHLSNKPGDDMPATSTTGGVAGRIIPRAGIGRLCAHLATTEGFRRQIVLASKKAPP